MVVIATDAARGRTSGCTGARATETLRFYQGRCAGPVNLIVGLQLKFNDGSDRVDDEAAAAQAGDHLAVPIAKGRCRAAHTAGAVPQVSMAHARLRRAMQPN